MKKLTIILIFLAICLNGFDQTFETKSEWVQFISRHSTVGLSANLGRSGFGIFYISKPVLNNTSIISTISTGKFFKENIQSNEIGLGLSIPVSNFSVDLMPIYNTIDKQYYDKINFLSMEIGIHTLIANINPIITVNPFLWTKYESQRFDIKVYIGIPIK